MSARDYSVICSVPGCGRLQDSANGFLCRTHFVQLPAGNKLCLESAQLLQTTAQRVLNNTRALCVQAVAK